MPIEDKIERYREEEWWIKRINNWIITLNKLHKRQIES